MTPLAISLVCVFAQVFLTIYAIVRMGFARVKSVQAKEVTIAQISLDSSAYSVRIQQMQNNVRNQFETPVLFFALIGIGAAVGGVNWGVALSSIGYVTARIIHHSIHVGTNRVGKRFNVFVVGLAFLTLGWISLAVSLLGIV